LGVHTRRQLVSPAKFVASLTLESLASDLFLPEHIVEVTLLQYLASTSYGYHRYRLESVVHSPYQFTT